MRRFSACALAWSLLLGLPLTPRAQTFAPAPFYAFTGPNGQPYGLAVSDVNADGNPDVVVANTYLSTLSVLLGRGTGLFAVQATAPSVGAGATPYCVAVGDVNGDGKPDALTANAGTSTLSVLLGDGLGGFALQNSLPSTGSGSKPLALVLADVNGDGKLDALTANAGTNCLGVLLGNGNGGFSLQANPPATGGDHPRALALADVNGDSRLDVLVANSVSSTLGVLLGNGAGGFAIARAIATGNFETEPRGVAIGDVNNDGQLDALTANFATSTVSVLLGNGQGGFALQPSSPYSSSYFGGQPAAVALADVNGDGNLDALAVNSNYGNNTVGILTGNGAGGFTVQPNSPSTEAYGTPFSLVAADVNNDGKPDLLAASVAYSKVSVLLNTTTYAPPTLLTASPSPVAVGGLLTLTGTNLASVRQINFTGATQPVIASKTATRLTVVVPPGAAPGPVSLTTPGGTSNALPLATVLATAPGALPGALASVYPNPLDAEPAAALLTATALPAAAARLDGVLLDVVGRPVRQFTLKVERGTVQSPVPCAGLPVGSYVLRLALADGQGQVLGVLPAQHLRIR